MIGRRSNWFRALLILSTGSWTCFASALGLETSPLASFRLHRAQVSNEPGARNPEQTRRLPLVVPGSLIDGSNMTPQRGTQRKIIAIRSRGNCWSCRRKHAVVWTFFHSTLGGAQGRLEHNMFRLNFLCVTEQNHRADCVMQFAQVPRPMIMQQQLHRCGMNRGELLSDRTRLGIQLCRDQAWKVFNPLAQRGNQQDQAGEPM